MGKDEPMVFI